ncbi:MAG: hypothetical protein ACE15C_01165 [Phycisphaerae bacterium]
MDIIQNQWLLLALGLGVVFVLAMALAYTAIWRPRQTPSGGEGAAPAQEGEPAPPGELPFGQWLRSYVPWILILTLLFVIVFMVVYTIMAATTPPNI